MLFESFFKDQIYVQNSEQITVIIDIENSIQKLKNSGLGLTSAENTINKEMIFFYNIEHITWSI